MTIPILKNKVIPMTLSVRLAEFIRACFTGIWIESHEHQDTLAEIAQLCRDEGWSLATWNVAVGLNLAGQTAEEAGSDPLSAIRAVNSLATPDGAAILVLQNFHRFLQSAEVVQTLIQQIIAGKQKTIWELKSQMLKKSGLLSLYRRELSRESVECRDRQLC